MPVLHFTVSVCTVGSARCISGGHVGEHVCLLIQVGLPVKWELGRLWLLRPAVVACLTLSVLFWIPLGRNEQTEG